MGSANHMGSGHHTGSGHRRVLVSAHRAPAGPGGGRARENLAAAVATGVDLAEVDVRRTGDGVFVIAHDASVTIAGRTVAIASLDAPQLRDVLAGDYLDLDAALGILAAAPTVAAHVDLKVRPPHAVAAVAAVVAALGAERTVVTTGSEESVATLRRWASDQGHPELLVGLSIGRGVDGLTPVAAARVVVADLFSGRRLRACGANLVVAQKGLARLTLARWARRHDVPLLVWTVDGDRELRRWMRPGRAWAVTTNRPGRALALAEQRSAPQG